MASKQPPSFSNQFLSIIFVNWFFPIYASHVSSKMIWISPLFTYLSARNGFKINILSSFMIILFIYIPLPMMFSSVLMLWQPLLCTLEEEKISILSVMIENLLFTWIADA